MPKIGYFDTKEFASKDGRASPWPTVVNLQLIELCNRIREKAPKFYPWLTLAACLIGFILCTAYVVDSSYNPFLYFRF